MGTLHVTPTPYFYVHAHTFSPRDAKIPVRLWEYTVFLSCLCLHPPSPQQTAEVYAFTGTYLHTVPPRSPFPIFWHLRTSTRHKTPHKNSSTSIVHANIDRTLHDTRASFFFLFSAQVVIFYCYWRSSTQIISVTPRLPFLHAIDSSALPHFFHRLSLSSFPRRLKLWCLLFFFLVFRWAAKRDIINTAAITTAVIILNPLYKKGSEIGLWWLRNKGKETPT